MAKRQKCGLSEDAELHDPGWVVRRGREELPQQWWWWGQCIPDMPWAVGSSSLVPEVCSQFLHSDSPLPFFSASVLLPSFSKAFFTQTEVLLWEGVGRRRAGDGEAVDKTSFCLKRRNLTTI